MSERSRLKKLAAEKSVSYQSLVQQLRDAETTPAELAAKHGWRYARAETFIINPEFDAEYAEISTGARYVRQEDCDNCGQAFFRSYDKKGTPVAGSNRYCPDCIESEGGVHECSRCGAHVFNSEELLACEGCWDQLMGND